MKNALLILFAILCSCTSLAQENLTTTKHKTHSISFYVGANAFENYKWYNQSPFDETYQSLNPYDIPSFSALSNLFSLTYKYKKHEIIPVIYLANYYTGNNKTKPFLMGASLSYLYHFSQKRAHLFFETNLQTLFYTTCNSYPDITPYGSSQNNNQRILAHAHAASIQTYILNPALGLEVKLWPLTYFQFAIGTGAFYTKGKPAIPTGITSQWDLPDNFRNTYPGVFGANWYARLSIIVRAFNF